MLLQYPTITACIYHRFEDLVDKQKTFTPLPKRDVLSQSISYWNSTQNGYDNFPMDRPKSSNYQSVIICYL